MKAAQIATLFALASLSGCAVDDYRLYSESITAIHTSKANAEAERYKAMAEVAKSGDTTVKVSAMMAMQSKGSSESQSVQIAAPKSFAEQARDWLGILVNPIVQGYGIRSNAQVSIAQSNNSVRQSESTNSTFLGIAGKIQAIPVVLPQANVTASGSAVIGDGSQSLAGTGAQGTGALFSNAPTSGSYNPVTDNSNQGNATATPTVVNPVVVTQPTPLIVSPVIVP